MFKKILSIFVLAMGALVAGTPLNSLNGGLFALNHPDKVAKDYEAYVAGKELSKEDRLVIEQVLEICKGSPGFSPKSLTSPEGYIQYKKLLSDYTYKVQEHLKQR